MSESLLIGMLALTFLCAYVFIAGIVFEVVYPVHGTRDDANAAALVWPIVVTVFVIGKVGAFVIFGGRELVRRRRLPRATVVPSSGSGGEGRAAKGEGPRGDVKFLPVHAQHEWGVGQPAKLVVEGLLNATPANRRP